MTRVTSQQIRQALLVTGEPVDPTNLEKLQLYNELGEPIDTGQDLSAMHWRGPWVGGVDYAPNDIVSYSNALWISPGGVPTDRVPGWMPDDPVVGTIYSQDYYASERIANTDPELITIGPPPGRYHPFVPASSGQNPGAIIFIDKSGTTTGLVLTIAGMSREGTPVDSDLNVKTYNAVSWSYIPGASGNIHYTLVDSHAPQNFSIPNDANDLVVVVSFATVGQLGSFNANVNSAANLVAPPDMSGTGAQWELMLQGVA